LLQFMGDEASINLKTTKSPEFDGWRWVSFWYPVRQVVSFKRDVYRKAMKEFASILLNESFMKPKEEKLREEKPKEKAHLQENTRKAPLVVYKPKSDKPAHFKYKKRKGARPKGYRK